MSPLNNGLESSHERSLNLASSASTFFHLHPSFLIFKMRRTTNVIETVKIKIIPAGTRNESDSTNKMTFAGIINQSDMTGGSAVLPFFALFFECKAKPGALSRTQRSYSRPTKKQVIYTLFTCLAPKGARHSPYCREVSAEQSLKEDPSSTFYHYDGYHLGNKRGSDKACLFADTQDSGLGFVVSAFEVNRRPGCLLVFEIQSCFFTPFITKRWVLIQQSLLSLIKCFNQRQLFVSQWFLLFKKPFSSRPRAPP